MSASGRDEPTPTGRTGIIRRQPTGSFPRIDPGPPVTGVGATAHPGAVRRGGPVAPCAAATVAILSGWATAVIATSLITNWWATDRLFCVAIGFLAAVSAAGTISGLIALLLRRRTGRVLITVGAGVAVLIFAGLFVAGARLPAVVYALPALPVAAGVLAWLPATGRWCPD